MRHHLSTLLLSLALAGPAARADELRPLPARADSAVAAAPAVERRIDPRLLLPAARAAALAFPQPNARQSVGLMIGGGAAVVAGAVVGGNVGGALAIGGVLAG